mgnify:CR=1 FL=1
MGYIPENNIKTPLNSTFKEIIVTSNDIGAGIIISSRWLSKDSDIVCILRTKEDNKTKLMCGRFLGKPLADEEKLVQKVVLWVEDADREKLIEMALRTSSTLLDTLSKIHRMVKEGESNE